MIHGPNPPGVRPPVTGSPDERLSFPATERNTAPIGALLDRVAPASGRAVEIASGTGQHIHAFASSNPRLHWQPTDIDPSRFASISAWTRGLPNVSAPIVFDAASDDWPGAPADFILLVNLLHLIPADDARRVVVTIANGLASGGVAVVYGPFRRDHGFASEGDAQFDASLRARDPAIGYKSVADFSGWVSRAGLEISETLDMPANNLAFVLKGAPGRGAAAPPDAPDRRGAGPGSGTVERP